MITLNDRELKILENKLNTHMSNFLYGSSTDSSWYECEAAALCFELLQMFKLQIKDISEARQLLEVNNIHNLNFIKRL